MTFFIRGRPQFTRRILSLKALDLPEWKERSAWQPQPFDRSQRPAVESTLAGGYFSSPARVAA